MKHLVYFFMLFSCPFVFCQGKGVEIYTINRFVGTEDCTHCFEIGREILSSKPLFGSNEIERFDFDNQQFMLTEKGKAELEKLDIPLRGIPVVFVLDGEPIYGFWLWNIYSSFYCNRVCTVPKLDFKLQFGLPSDTTHGTDPRFDKRIKEYFKNEH